MEIQSGEEQAWNPDDQSGETQPKFNHNFLRWQGIKSERYNVLRNSAQSYDIERFGVNLKEKTTEGPLSPPK